MHMHNPRDVVIRLSAPLHLTVFVMCNSKCLQGLEKGSHAMLRFIAEKLQAILSRPNRVRVRNGHFVVIATKAREPQRFVIKLCYLHNPEFLKLLKQAEEEFGFSQEGVIGIPCRSDELRMILTMSRS